MDVFRALIPLVLAAEDDWYPHSGKVDPRLQGKTVGIANGHNSGAVLFTNQRGK